MNIGFIGLGNMGSGMATNLLEYCQQNGHRLWVFDINPTAVSALLKAGAVEAGTVASLCAQVDVLFTSLPSSKEVKDISLGEDGILENLPSGATWFETSTGELSIWDEIKSLAPSDINLIDAPVTGGAEGAAAGSLTMLLGIDAELLREHETLLKSFTNKALRMGPSGAGYVSKLCQLHLNYLVAEGIGEALMLGAKANIDMHSLYDVLQNSCAQSYVVDAYIPKVLDGSYDPSFTLGLANKDMRLIAELGQHLNVPLKLADSVYEDYQLASETFGIEQPHLKIVKLLEDRVGLELRGNASSESVEE